MFNDLISTLNRLLSGHEYVTQVSKEKNDMLRENDKLRNEVQLLRDEMDKLKRSALREIAFVVISQLRFTLLTTRRQQYKRNNRVIGSLNVTFRKHVKDKKTICELEKLSSSRLQESSSLKVFSPQHNSSSTQREDDLKLIEMLREVKTALQDGHEIRGHRDYIDAVGRLKEVGRAE